MSAAWRVPPIASGYIGSPIGGEILIGVLRSEYCDDGSFAVWRPSHGAKCLADWLMRSACRAARFDGRVAPETLNRLLIGAIVPDRKTLSAIASATIGTIMPDLFNDVAAMPTNMLGHRPECGPLARAVRVADGYVLELPGVRLTMDSATAAMARDALAGALGGGG